MTTSQSDHKGLLPRAGVAACFFWTAPVSVFTGGAVLLSLGEQTLSNHWSPLTMGLTHIGTLGFITMTLMGSYYFLVPLQLNRSIKAPRLPYFVYVTFAIGTVSLCVGLAGTAVTPVFIAIGALFPALGCFFWPAIASLRGTRGQPNAIPLRLAIGSFVIVATIGIWVAHGHGGMKFPGPRALWIQVHLAIALFGWVGGMAGATFDLLSRARTPASGDLNQGISNWWGRLLWLGIALPSVLLGLQYLALIELSQATANWLAAVAITPGAIAAWWIQPLYGLKKPRDPMNAIAEPHYWQTAFCLAPITFVLGIIALLHPAPQWQLAFGWVALWGWAGMLVHASLREFSGNRFANPLQEQAEVPVRDLAFALHLASLATGIAAIAVGGPALARLTGALLLVLGVNQLNRMVRITRARRAVE